MEPMLVFTAEQTARVLQMSTRKVHRLLETGEIPGIKIGGSWRVSGRLLYQQIHFGPWPKSAVPANDSPHDRPQDGEESRPPGSTAKR